MKKIVILVAVMLVAASSFAQIAVGVDAGAFANAVGFQASMMGITAKAEQVATVSTIGAYVDGGYISVGASYATTFGDITMTQYLNGTKESSATFEGQAATYLIADLIAKYPIEMGNIVVFPGVGVRYAKLLGATVDGKKIDIPEEAERNMSDLFLSLVGGLDLNLSDSLYVRGMARFDYNMTPAMFDDVPSELTTYGYGVGANVSVGFRL